MEKLRYVIARCHHRQYYLIIYIANVDANADADENADANSHSHFVTGLPYLSAELNGWFYNLVYHYMLFVDYFV